MPPYTTLDPIRQFTLILGIGLLVLWVSGLNGAGASAWLVWLDGIAALFAIVIAAIIRPFMRASARASGPLALSLGLLALSGAGLLKDATSWLVGWTFAFACAFLTLAIFAAVPRERLSKSARLEFERNRERFRKGA